MPLLAFHNLFFSRPDSQGNPRPVLSNISWSVDPGQVAAILGANGSGKSTLLRLAVGYLWPQRGTVSLLNHTLGEIPLAPLRAQVGIVEATTIYPFDDAMSALDVATSGYFSSLTLGYVHPTPDQRSHAAQLLDQVGLTTHHDQLYLTLSTGERLRCLLARALVRKPALLLLDEPTAGLDLPARETLLATLHRLHLAAARQGIPPAIIMITHHLEELLPGTANILLLSPQGQIVAQGPPAKVLTDSLLSQTYNVPVHVSESHGRYTAHVDPQNWPNLL